MRVRPRANCSALSVCLGRVCQLISACTARTERLESAICRAWAAYICAWVVALPACRLNVAMFCCRCTRDACSKRLCRRSRSILTILLSAESVFSFSRLCS